MKFFLPLWLVLSFAAPLLAQQNYQYQYPYDPYNSTPTPQPNASSSSANYSGGGGGGGGGYAYDKLLSYSSLQALYAFNDFKGDNRLSGASGLNAALNLQLFKPVYLHFGVDWLSGTDDYFGDFNMTSLSAGAGVYLPLFSRFHIFGEVGLRYDTTSGVLDAIHHDNFSVYVKPGLRFAATERLELDASVYFSSTDNLDDRAVQVNAYYNLVSALDLNLGVDFGSDINSYHGGLRFRW